MEDVRTKVYALFREMNPGDKIIIAEFAKRDPEGFIKYGKDFIDEGNHNYEFTDGYVAFRRMWHLIEFKISA